MSSSVHAKCEDGEVGQLLCHDAQVRQLDKKLNREWTRIQCSGEHKKDFIAQQKFWLRQRYSCNNEKDTRTCLVNQISQRNEFLAKLNSCTDPASVVRYAFTDPWHILKYPALYVGSTVHVYGRLSLASCADKAKSLHGLIHGERQQNIAVLFESLDAVDREFICTRNASAHWEGKIKLNGQTPYLSMFNLGAFTNLD